MLHSLLELFVLILRSLDLALSPPVNHRHHILLPPLVLTQHECLSHWLNLLMLAFRQLLKNNQMVLLALPSPRRSLPRPTPLTTGQPTLPLRCTIVPPSTNFHYWFFIRHFKTNHNSEDHGHQ